MIGGTYTYDEIKIKTGKGPLDTENGIWHADPELLFNFLMDKIIGISAPIG